jgi:o-succinylbenzoate synthase
MSRTFVPVDLDFKKPAATSRGALTKRWVGIFIEESSTGIKLGEAAPLEGLSRETVVEAVEDGHAWAQGGAAATASGRMAAEMAARDAGNGRWFGSDFLTGAGRLRINGLVWMAPREEVEAQVQSLLSRGFETIKIKVGAKTLAADLDLVRWVRREAPCVQIRVDANGSFSPETAAESVHHLAEAGAASIEQPIAPGQWEQMARLCASAPLQIALDEELIGLNDPEQRDAMLDAIAPHLLVLKPSLIGGFASSEDWIERAERRGLGWWATSALESGIGLAALAQWLAAKGGQGIHGLGTGSLFVQNFGTPLRLNGQELSWAPEGAWDLSLIGR